MGTHRQPAGKLQISFMFNRKRQHKKQPASLRSAELRNAFFSFSAQLRSQQVTVIGILVQNNSSFPQKNIIKLLRGHGN
jgi:hypothetical protein